MSKKKKTPGLDPWTMKHIQRTLAEGVSYSVNWRNLPGPTKTTAIHWRPPVDPSASLARSIIDKVHRHGSPMPLELDGHLYLITAVDGQLVPNEHGGVQLQPYVPARRKDKKKAKAAKDE